MKSRPFLEILTTYYSVLKSTSYTLTGNCSQPSVVVPKEQLVFLAHFVQQIVVNHIFHDRTLSCIVNKIGEPVAPHNNTTCKAPNGFVYILVSQHDLHGLHVG